MASAYFSNMVQKELLGWATAKISFKDADPFFCYVFCPEEGKKMSELGEKWEKFLLKVATARKRCIHRPINEGVMLLVNG